MNEYIENFIKFAGKYSKNDEDIKEKTAYELKQIDYNIERYDAMATIPLFELPRYEAYMEAREYLKNTTLEDLKKEMEKYKNEKL